MLKGGSVFVFSGASFLRRPLLWLETMTRVKATIPSAPNFAYEYCVRDDKVPQRALERLDLSAMRVLINASEPVRAGTCERFNANSPDVVSPCGRWSRSTAWQSEGRVRLTVNTKQLKQNRVRVETPKGDGYSQTSLVSCGRPLDGIALRIVDGSTGVALGEDQVGEVWIAGKSKAQGYFNRPDLNATLFAATIPGEMSGGEKTTYLRTGDLGFLHDAELFICGRLKDMIAGRNYYPNDIEAESDLHLAISSDVLPDQLKVRNIVGFRRLGEHRDRLAAFDSLDRKRRDVSLANLHGTASASARDRRSWGHCAHIVGKNRPPGMQKTFRGGPNDRLGTLARIRSRSGRRFHYRSHYAA
jgi:acyl-CoA synthetase (AMP-forming)/AMP-acid ligase II